VILEAKNGSVGARLSTRADGILDRLVNNAHRIEMRGEWMRKKSHPQPDNKEEKDERQK
jgi:hypothetical protein